MAPPAAEADLAPSQTTALPHGINKAANGPTATSYTPLEYSGSLDEHRSFDVTPIIGREFLDLQLSSILSSDDQIRDLAILVSQRGVVFFRNQTLTIPEQKTLAHKLGLLTGKPPTSGLHRHALFNSKRGLSVDASGTLDDEVSIINSQQFQRLYGDRYSPKSTILASDGWHADITFERVPSDYAILKIVEAPADGAGGDTLWASGYEAFDRLSPAYQRLAEGLTATHHQPEFNQIAKQHGEELIDDARGAPENVGLDFTASHPVVRTNPVTGWKSLFAAGGQVKAGWIDGVTERESEDLKRLFLDLIAQNRKSHDLEVGLS
jgi:alpha-ketoglutarate-dependent taurine dioxygenase